MSTKKFAHWIVKDFHTGHLTRSGEGRVGRGFSKAFRLWGMGLDDSGRDDVLLRAAFPVKRAEYAELFFPRPVELTRWLQDSALSTFD